MVQKNDFEGASGSENIAAKFNHIQRKSRISCSRYSMNPSPRWTTLLWEESQCMHFPRMAGVSGNTGHV